MSHKTLYFLKLILYNTDGERWEGKSVQACSVGRIRGKEDFQCVICQQARLHYSSQILRALHVCCDSLGRAMPMCWLNVGRSCAQPLSNGTVMKLTLREMPSLSFFRARLMQ